MCMLCAACFCRGSLQRLFGWRCVAALPGLNLGPCLAGVVPLCASFAAPTSPFVFGLLLVAALRDGRFVMSFFAVLAA